MATNSAYLSSIVFVSFSLSFPINVLGISTEKRDVIRMLTKTEPSLMSCDADVYNLVKECLTELGNVAKIFTFNGTFGDSEPVERLFEMTGTE